MANSLRNCIERIQCKSMVERSEFDCCRLELASSSGFMHHCKSCNTVGKEQQLMSDKANLISSSVALALGRPGARYHVGYPVLARSVFGMLVIMSRLIGDPKSINLLTASVGMASSSSFGSEL